jgi:hypothetical protein
VRLCQFFGCGSKKFPKWEHFSTKKSYWVSLLWSDSWCVYFKRPNTLLLCTFLFCIFLLYRADPQVEVQIRILFKDKYRKSSQNANTGNHTLISWTMLIGFLYFGVVHTYMDQKVMPLTSSQGYFCTIFYIRWARDVTSPSTTTQTTNKHHHHGDGTTRPSGGVDSMNPRRPSGGWPCAYIFRGRCWRV